MTEIVGILNVTPDSFSDGFDYYDIKRSVERIEEMFEEGADRIDIGAESTFPGRHEITPGEEWERLEPIVKRAQNLYPPDKFSIDTRHWEVAETVAVCWSPEITINDVSGLSDQRMIEIIASYGLKVIIGHLPKRAHGNMRLAHQEKMTDIRHVRDDLTTKYTQAITQGIPWENITVDPGIGFGKSPQLSKELLSFANLVPNIPVMIGHSRKGFLGARRRQVLANVEAGKIAAQSGAAYLRVHDVANHARMLKDLSS